MIERAAAWRPLPNIKRAFGSISLSLKAESPARTVLLTLHGERNLRLGFSGVIALHFEDECPGNFPIPSDLPRLNQKYTFPLLTVERSSWAAQWPMWPDLMHYVLISLDDIVHILGSKDVEAIWGAGDAA